MKENESILKELRYGNLTLEQEQKSNEDNVFTRSIDIFKKEPFPSVEETIDELLEMKETIKSRMASESWLEIKSLINQIDSNPLAIIGGHVVELGIEFKEDYFNKIASKLSAFILALKKFYNRPRPSQFSFYCEQKINPFNSKTLNSPSYPSGYVLQSYFICKVISFHNPDKEKEIMEIADIISMSRNVMGVNYKSDCLFAQYIVDELVQIKQVKDIYFNEKKLDQKNTLTT